MSTKVIKNRQSKKPDINFRLLQARGALEQATRPRHLFTILHAALYQDNIRVHYLLDGYRKSCIITLENLTAHTLETYSSTSRMSDVVVYYYIEENLNAVCQSYLVGGKEIEAL